MGIAVLPVHLVNKIAAGEVIERPASLVKELVENALDAGATRIDVTVEQGGTKLIAVADDGSGMDEADLSLAFAPHATSKLAGEADLEAIGTLGFRGEALASIASVSHAHIRTCRRESEGGFEIRASGETLQPVRPCAAPPGTTVTIRDLFFNTPARRKFLRTPATEFGHITEQVTRLALPHPHVTFSLTHNGRSTLSLPAADSTLQRIASLFGQDLADALLPVSPGKGPVRVTGLAGLPSAVRSSAKWQYMFLNGRYIRDRLLGHAVREAYRGLIDPRTYPVVFVFLEIDPADVDVNVHPTKIEVRFRDGQTVHSAVLGALRETLNHANLSREAQLDATPTGEQDSDRQQSLRQALADFLKSAPPPQPRLDLADQSSVKSHPQGFSPPPHNRELVNVFEASPLALRQGSGQAASRSPSSFSPPAQHAPGIEAPPPHASALQIHDTYLVVAAEDGLVIVDQHALHERVLYNELRARLTGGSLTSQRLLIPETLEVTVEESAALERSSDLLAKLGIEVSAFGATTVAVQQFPALLAERGVAATGFLREILDRLADDETVDPERAMEDLLQMMACKAAVKAGQTLTPAEIDALLVRLDTVEKSSSCPHGRPTALRLTLKDLEKQFKRI